MTYINVDLRLNNLTAAFNEALQDLFNSFKLSEKNVVSNDTKEDAEAINDSADYYANAPKRGTAAVNIDRKLKAQGNAW
ncbi:MAG: hypothetical protein OFPI_03970 [Osedax symbiont Rs2]|nr:MAG: hypothetical protein OFPI_03970 [Osedax symbiont Rs2]